MTDQTPQVETRELTLLSDALRAVLQHPENAPEYRNWTSNLPADIFDIGLYDELYMIGIATVMMELARRMFSFFPEQIINLGNALHKATNAGDDYKRFALTRQELRLKRLGMNDKEKLSIQKTLRCIGRGIARRVENLTNLNDPDKFFEDASSRALRVIRGSKSETAMIHDIVESFSADLQRSIARVEKLTSELWDMTLTAEKLERELAVAEAVETLIGLTRTRLDNLGGPLTLPEAQPEAQQPIHTTEPSIKPAKTRRKRKNGIPSRPRKSKRRGGKAKKSGPAIKPETRFDAVDSTINKLSEAMTIAGPSGKIRIVIPIVGRWQSRHESQWAEIFNMLGYEGTLEFVLFKDLGRTSDAVSPILIPKNMNTHQNLWDKASFDNVLVLDIANPGSMISCIRAQQR